VPVVACVVGHCFTTFVVHPYLSLAEMESIWQAFKQQQKHCLFTSPVLTKMDSGNNGILSRTLDQAAQGSQGTLVCINGYNVRSLVVTCEALNTRWILHCSGRAKQYAVESLHFSTPNEPKYFKGCFGHGWWLSITNLKYVGEWCL
jgi:hypothetical protein